MIKKVGDKYVLFSKDGKKKLGSSTSYQAMVNREKEVEMFKNTAREKKKNGKV